VIAAAVRYFAGEAIDFSDVPLDLGEQESLLGGVDCLDRLQQPSLVAHVRG